MVILLWQMMSVCLKSTGIRLKFRTLGCWPLTGAVESGAATIEEIVEEMMTTTKSERTTRVIDFDQEGSMEQKKREGYF